MREDKINAGWLCAGALLLLACLAAVEVAAGSDPVRVSRDALRVGDRTHTARGAFAAPGRVLEPYARYWTLVPRLGKAPASEIKAFLDDNEGTLLAEALRARWLKHLGSNGLWQDFDREYAALAGSDRELQCFALQSRLQRRDEGALDEARELWTNVDLPEACDVPLAALHAIGRVGQEQVWERTRRLVEQGRIAAARSAVELLSPAERPDYAALAQSVNDSATFLDRRDAQSVWSRADQELVAASLARLARADPRAAAERFGYVQRRLSPAQRRYVYAQLGWQAARRHLPEAIGWYQAAGDTPLSDEQLAWKARAGLRAADWWQVLASSEAMPPSLATQPDWIYWRARALASLGRANDAQLLYRSVAGQPSFYGSLAAEEIGNAIDVPPAAAAPTRSEIAEVGQQPGIRRALALWRLGLRADAAREWNWALRGRSDRFLIAAAETARRNQLFDRAIAAAERTRDEHDFALRYLAPYREEVGPKAGALDLDEAWVYGLIRQESRFVPNARSWAGASGLMQLMPATAHWLGRRLGMKRLTADRISDRATNIALGTNYLRLVLSQLDDHPVLASAAYNAGPGRAARWRDSRALEGAVYAETIPIAETRDYVKKVMSNAVYYAALFEGRPQSLKSRLGLVRSRSTAGSSGDAVAAAQDQ